MQVHEKNGFIWFHEFFCLDFFKFSDPLCFLRHISYLLEPLFGTLSHWHLDILVKPATPHNPSTEPDMAWREEKIWNPRLFHKSQRFRPLRLSRKEKYLHPDSRRHLFRQSFTLLIVFICIFSSPPAYIAPYSMQ